MGMYQLSYQVVDTLIWLGIRGIINDFRKKELKLRPITYLSGSQASISNLPTGYLWSPHIVPKPKDWGPLIDIVGYCFLNLAEDYKPPEDLVKWLASGTPPIYIGFGSLPVGDPDGMTNIIVEALQKTNQRGLINQGWGGMGQCMDTSLLLFPFLLQTISFQRLAFCQYLHLVMSVTYYQ
jgi:sterol 3beta-glucosyltransferase